MYIYIEHICQIVEGCWVVVFQVGSSQWVARGASCAAASIAGPFASSRSVPREATETEDAMDAMIKRWIYLLAN